MTIIWPYTIKSVQTICIYIYIYIYIYIIYIHTYIYIYIYIYIYLASHKDAKSNKRRIRSNFKKKEKIIDIKEYLKID